MRLLISRLKGLTELFVLTLLLMVGAGGNAVAGWYTSPEGSDGGFTGRPLITVEISADKTSVPVNLAGLAPNPALPYASTITVVVKQDGRLFPTSITVSKSTTIDVGSLFQLDALDNPLRQVVLSGTDGTGLVLFNANTTPGEVIITATAQDPNTSQTVSASLKITVVGESRPATSMMFTGPYVNAVFAGESRFGTAAGTPIQDGNYSRVVSVLVTDANGNPTYPNTQVNFYMIDGPLTLDSYPNNPGAFLVAGNNGVPQVNGLNFNAASGQFLTKGVRPLDRLILDGGQMHTVQTVTSETSLGIQSIKPFGADSRSTIPYVIGRANNATILSPSFTNLSGVADTIVTYPVSRVGQTAILVACVAGL
ncbi:MAG: hypothetical protein QG599_3464, partial [Pseudomonadota bacterium]|nr:hypothetical protein [Pseudomonadota bacterium]